MVKSNAVIASVRVDRRIDRMQYNVGLPELFILGGRVEKWLQVRVRRDKSFEMHCVGQLKIESFPNFIAVCKQYEE